MLEEDRWVPHLVELAHGVTESAKHLNCYILMDTCEAAPQRDENRNAMMSITDCGYFTIAFQNDPWEIVAAHSDDWIRALSEGRVGSVFHSIRERGRIGGYPGGGYASYAFQVGYARAMMQAALTV